MYINHMSLISNCIVIFMKNLILNKEFNIAFLFTPVIVKINN
jgi:hypothetical protein